MLFQCRSKLLALPFFFLQVFKCVLNSKKFSNNLNVFHPLTWFCSVCKITFSLFTIFSLTILQKKKYRYRNLYCFLIYNSNCLRTQWNSIVFQVACKYIENPVLFHREDVGQVKFDVRYLVLISSAKPLVLHADKVFWLRFANQ